MMYLAYMPRPMTPGGYQAHTVYLTELTWQALDRGWAERRTVEPSLSKIAFVEAVLSAGLHSLTTTEQSRGRVESK
jgi:hypothetical protein